MASPSAREQNLAAWVALFAGLEHGRLPDRAAVAACAAPDVVFRDPFNEVRGHDGIRRVLAHTLNQMQGVRLVTLDTAWSRHAAFLKWEMSARVRLLGQWTVTGVSEITFDDEGRVAAHVDYWDAASQLYARMPVVGGACRWLLRKGAAS